MKITIFDTLPSTNDYCEAREFDEDTAIIAREQTGGKGTKGRSFSSPLGGVYLSLVRYYPCKAENSFSLMIASCMAVVKTLEFYGVHADIKWPNDVFVSGKKICGILIKNSFEGENVKKSITGIGVNVNNDIPQNLADIAISLKSVVGEVDVEDFYKRLIGNLYADYSVDEYRSRNIVLGKDKREITVIRNGESRKAVAEDIAPDGSLVLKGGERLFYGEVTIRF
ncbi:MAG: biotin--[acetyl-CoA-carboxylase] ligase [Clostridiales bacterium]|nr:biotin--[acetyl-CoA-carboxylase] ligase [Clostridiales bacterium]